MLLELVGIVFGGRKRKTRRNDTLDTINMLVSDNEQYLEQQNVRRIVRKVEE